MRILPHTLLQHFKKESFTLYLVRGEEPLQHQESLDQLRLAAKQQGYAERERYDLAALKRYAHELIETFQTASLFSPKRLIELHLPEKLTTTLHTALNSLVSSFPLPDQFIVLSHTTYDRQLESEPWFKQIETKGAIITARPFNRAQMKNWIHTQFKIAELPLDPPLIEALLDRTEGHLLAAKQAIEKLRGLARVAPLSVDALEALVPQNAQFRLFEVIETALSGQAERMLSMLKQIRATEEVDPYLMLWALQQTLSKTSRPLPLSPERCIVELQAIDEIIKGRRLGDAWQALTALLLALCHIKILHF